VSEKERGGAKEGKRKRRLKGNSRAKEKMIEGDRGEGSRCDETMDTQTVKTDNTNKRGTEGKKKKKKKKKESSWTTPLRKEGR
jgi:hypothetical protein